MKILIAIDSYKGTLESKQAGNIVKKAFLRVFGGAEIEVLSVADGGEGTVAAIMENNKGTIRHLKVMGPLGEAVRAAWGISGKIAVIEMAQASGLTLMRGRNPDPMCATTYGTGQLIKKALDEGAGKLIIGIGGSATNDGGAGMAQALGVRFLNADGNELQPGGAALLTLKEIDLNGLDRRVHECEIIVACDVKNPLYGPDGASFVYGPQKGADPEQAAQLDNALRQLAKVLKEKTGMNYAEIPGAGAAGGLGFGLMAFCGGKLKSGIEIVLEASKLRDKIKNTDLVITGEGCMDRQALNGKAPMGIAAAACEHNIPVIAIAGQVKGGGSLMDQLGLDAAIACVNRILTMEDVKKEVEESLFTAGLNAARLMKIGMHLNY
jgi:glycerate kinase